MKSSRRGTTRASTGHFGTPLNHGVNVTGTIASNLILSLGNTLSAIHPNLPHFTGLAVDTIKRPSEHSSSPNTKTRKLLKYLKFPYLNQKKTMKPISSVDGEASLQKGT